MKIFAAAALIASSFTPVALPAFVSAAAADAVDGSFCNLRAPASSGWACDQRVSSVIYYSEGQATFDSVTCYDFARTSADYVGINPGGREMGNFSYSGVNTDTLLAVYDGSYTGCNYPPDPDGPYGG
jgi:hypothetical protein